MSASTPFRQDIGSTGIVAIEAENYRATSIPAGHAWVERTDVAGYFGGAFVRAEPATATNINTGFEVNSPRLDYQIEFKKTGVHFVWVLGFAEGGADDSCHVGLDGAPVRAPIAFRALRQASGHGRAPRWTAALQPPWKFPTPAPI